MWIGKETATPFVKLPENIIVNYGGER